MVKARRRIVYRKKAQNRFSLILAAAVAAIVLGLIVPRGWKLRTQLQEYTAQKEALEAQISSEEKRAEELEEYAKYTKTDEYVEKVAREKLGLVKKGEILFRSSAGTGTGTSSSSGSTAQRSESAAENVQEDAALNESAGQEAAGDAAAAAETSSPQGQDTAVQSQDTAAQSQATVQGQDTAAQSQATVQSQDTAVQSQTAGQAADLQGAAAADAQSTDSTSVWEQTAGTQE